jgi:hypothetical protein
MKPYEYKKENLTKDQKNNIKIWVQKSKEANFNINYGFSANQNIKRGDYEALAISNYQGYMEGRNSNKTFDEWLTNKIEYAEKSIKERNEANKSAESIHDFDFAFENAKITRFEEICLGTKINNIYQNLAKDEKDSAKLEAIAIAYKKAQAFVRKAAQHTQVCDSSAGVTGPIYDNDSNPTYYDEKMNEI